MSELIRQFIKKAKPQFLKTKRYLEANDWSNHVPEFDEEGREKKYNKEGEFDVQDKAAKIIVNRLKYLVKKSEGDHHLKIFKDFIKESLSIIDIHTDRVDNYINNTSLEDMATTDLKKKEMDFHNTLYERLVSVEDALSALNIKDENQDTSGITFHDNVKAPLSMHETLVEIFPEIKRKVESMKIDFTSAPKNEMLIYMDNVPVWNLEKHYFEQERDTLQFYVDEFKKIRNGINIDGQPIEPWLYFHMNHFVTEIPTPTYNKVTKRVDIKKVVQRPPLRDNEWYIIQDNYRQAKIDGKILFIAATRRLFKSTGLASHLHHIAITGGKELVVAGGSAKDLGQLEKNVKVSMLNCNPAFSPNNLTNDWSKKVQLGIKTKGGKIIPQAIIHVINLNSGGEKASEVLAGFTPDAFVIDEVMKAPFIDQLNGAKPSFDTPHGKLCTAILSGTGGNEELSRDALVVLNDPEDYDILPMNWDALERGIDKEDIKWTRRKFGTFAPAAMSAKDGMLKIKSNLAKYLGRPESEELAKIEIMLTDWGKCNEIIAADRKKLSKHKPSLTKEIVYYPNDPEEIFLSGKANPFPKEEASRHLAYIREVGLTGRKVDLFRSKDSKKVSFELSEKELPKFPHKGGFHDSPVIIFGEFPKEKPPRGLFVASLDDYKQEEADSDSLGCFIIFKRQSGNDDRGDKIAAIYTSRPNPHSKFHRVGHMLLEAYNAECLMENEDMSFKTHLDTVHKTEEYLVPTFNIAGDITLKTNGRRTYGISPSGNKSAIISMAINHCHKIYHFKDADGTDYSVMGVETIDDEMLLEEIINYKDGENHDRITTLGIALIQAHYLDTNYVVALLKAKQNTEVVRRDSQKRLFTNTRRGLF
jgi:hypothetical protein